MFEPDEWHRILEVLSDLDTEWIVASDSLPPPQPGPLTWTHLYRDCVTNQALPPLH